MDREKEYKHAAIYARVSTNTQADKGTGIDLQLERCRNTCREKGYEIINEYIDDGVSGTKDIHKRKKFPELLKDAADGKFDVLVFFSFDRLARDLRVFLSIVDELRKINIKIVSCKEDIDTTTKNGDFMMNIYATIANLELETIKERLKLGREQKRKTRGYVGGRVPYGYKVINKEVFIDEEKAKIIRKVFTYASEGQMSLATLANIFNDERVPTPTGKGKWYPSTVSRILKNVDKYNGCIMNDNDNDICWPKILN